ncbi:MAG: hypothetical protein NC131_18025 [Roseburia sp.]|nr:hypothetical protein [Roseburia sp.]
MSKLEDMFYMYTKRTAQTITKRYNIPYDESQQLVKGIIHYVLSNISTKESSTENKEEE